MFLNKGNKSKEIALTVKMYDTEENWKSRKALPSTVDVKKRKKKTKKDEGRNNRVQLGTVSCFQTLS